jgi:hypothetical protein
LDARGCTIHRKEGPDAKPGGCSRFPYGLTATPVGGRVTTEHRCPCRSMIDRGARGSISIDDAERSLRDRAGRLEVDRVVPGRIEVTEKLRIPFLQYVAIETQLIERLNRGELAESVLEQKPLPELKNRSWHQVAADHLDCHDGSSGGDALIWFGDGLLELCAGHKPPERTRPWAAAFERAAARTPRGESPERIYNDWLADELWMFRWLPWGPLDVGLAELATRLAVARTLAKRIEALGARADQAAAEAVMICELTAEASEWPFAVADIEPQPSKELSWLAPLLRERERATRKGKARKRQRSSRGGADARP